MEMVPYDFAEFVTQVFLCPADENDLSALLLVIGHCLRSSLGTSELTELTETRFAFSKVRLLPGVRAWRTGVRSSMGPVEKSAVCTLCHFSIMWMNRLERWGG